MSLDKAIEHRKEKRRPYYGSKAIDRTCRNHGGCPWCEENRQIHNIKESEKMRVEITYYADDDTEFCTEEECIAYEAKLKSDFDSVLFFDDAFNHLDECSQSTFESAWYMKILDGEKADRLMKWQYGYYGVCFDGLPNKLHDGDIYAWDNITELWYNPVEKLEKYKAAVAAITKAVAKL